MIRCRFVLMLVLLGACVAGANAQNVGSYGKRPLPGDTGPPTPENAGFDYNLGQMLPKGLTFRDQDNNSVTIEGLANGKPTILILAYFRCPKLCNQVIAAVLDGLKDLRKRDSTFVAGGPFHVVVLSIDPKEPVPLARQRRELFLQDYDQRDPNNSSGVWFLTSNEGQGTDLKAADAKIHQLANAVGYRYTLRANSRDYTYTPDGWIDPTGAPLRDNVRNYDYAHGSGIVFLSPEGKITRYLLGINYDARSIRQAIIEASEGTVGSFLDRNISPYCYVYDNTKGHYVTTMRYLGLAAAPFMIGVLAMTYWTIKRASREKPVTLPTSTVASVSISEPGSTGR